MGALGTEGPSVSLISVPAPVTRGCREVPVELHASLFFHISFSGWCKRLPVSEGASCAAWLEEAGCFLSPASKVSCPLVLS